ncbi:hypothetical protein [Methanococcoides vulcani]|nr:hypothetical protein [Methanococcoides vulcani]
MEKDGTLREVEKMITRPYITTVDNYADMLGRTATFPYNNLSLNKEIET